MLTLLEVRVSELLHWLLDPAKTADVLARFGLVSSSYYSLWVDRVRGIATPIAFTLNFGE